MINNDYEKIDVDASYPDILRRGELQPRGDEREEKKKQRHISFRTISEKILFFHSRWNELSGVAETFAVSESAVVALLLQLRLPPPPVAPITAGGAVSPSGSCKTWPPSLPPLFSLSPSSFLASVAATDGRVRGHLMTVSLWIGDLSSTLCLCFIDGNDGTIHHVSGGCN